SSGMESASSMSCARMGLPARTTSGDDRPAVRPGARGRRTSSPPRPHRRRRSAVQGEDKMTQRHELLDPELAAPLEGFLGAVNGGFDLGDIPGARRTIDGVVAAVKAN